MIPGQAEEKYKMILEYLLTGKKVRKYLRGKTTPHGGGISKGDRSQLKWLSMVKAGTI